MLENSSKPRWKNCPKSTHFSILPISGVRILSRSKTAGFVSILEISQGVLNIYCQFWLGAKLGNSGTRGKLAIGECVFMKAPPCRQECPGVHWERSVEITPSTVSPLKCLSHHCIIWHSTWYTVGAQ